MAKPKVPASPLAHLKKAPTVSNGFGSIAHGGLPRSHPAFVCGVTLTRRGNGTENDLAESHAAGFRFHLTKPASFAQLEKHLAEFPSLPGASS